MPTARSVIVAGAGPVGMTAAAALAAAGLDVTVVEAAAQISKEWRASTFHPPTLEHLRPLDVVEEMISLGLVADHYQIRSREHGLVADFDYAALKDDTDFPFRLQLEQYKLVELFESKLAGLDNARVLLDHRVRAVSQDSGGVEVVLATPGGTQTMRADYLVAADGASSTVRHLLELAFEGWTYEQRFLLISVDLPFEDYLDELCYVNYIADPREFVMLLRIPDVWRVLVPVAEGVEEDVATSPARMQQVIDGILGRDVGWRASEIRQHQLYRIHQRVAERFNVGRVLLMGDAAHVNSPIGGFGLNSGIHDALDLAARLTRVEGAGTAATSEALDAYGLARRTVALAHIRAMSDRNTRTLTEADAAARQVDQRNLADIAADPIRTREWLLAASMMNAVREHPIGG